jgi:hypothetical protein
MGDDQSTYKVENAAATKSKALIPEHRIRLGADVKLRHCRERASKSSRRCCKIVGADLRTTEGLTQACLAVV